MAVNKEVLQLDITGNFDRSLTQLRSEINKSKKAWKELSDTFAARGAGFRSEEEELKNLVGALTGTEQAAYNAKETLVDLDSAERTLAKASNSLVRAQNKLNVERAKELTVLDQLRNKTDPQILQARAQVAALKQLTKALQDTATQREFERLAAEAGIDLSKRKTAERTAEAIATERAAKAEKELAIASLLAQQGRLPSGKLAPPPKPAAGSDEEERLLRNQVLEEKAKRLRDERLTAIRKEEGLINSQGKRLDSSGRELGKVAAVAEVAESKVNKFLFTFRRLVGVMAAFTVARVVVGGFRDMIAGAVRFNAAIETNRVGLTGLIAAAGDIRDAEGKRVPLAQQLNLAQDISIDQMNKLRTAALQTAASYEELSTAFTQAVAPGISAGLTLDQIRKVTADISQAASGLGVAQNQLSEEIRSLFQGTINPRNTRVATALGITSADIARAKEVGNLFQFLQTRFAAISATGQRLMNTFTGQLSNATDAFSQLLAATSQPLFEQLKSGLQELQKGIFTVIGENSAFNPQALKAFQGLFDGLAAGVAGIRKAFEDIDVQGFADTFGLIGQALGFAAASLAKAFVIFFDVAAPAVTAGKALFAIFSRTLVVLKEMNAASDGTLGKFVLTASKVGLVFLLASKTLGAVKGIFGWVRLTVNSWVFMTTATKAAGAAAVAVEGTVRVLRKGLLATSAITLVIAGLLTLVAKALPDGTKDTIFDRLAKGINYVTSGLDELIDRMVTLPEEAKKATGGALGIVGDSLRGISGDIAEVVKELQKTARQIDSETRISRDTLGASPEIADQRKQLSAALLAGSESLLEAKRKEKELQSNLLSIQQRGGDLVLDQVRKQNELKAALKARYDIATALQALEAKEAKTPKSKELSFFMGLPFLAKAADTTKQEGQLRKTKEALRKELEQADADIGRGTKSAQLNVDQELNRLLAEMRLTEEAIAKAKAEQRTALDAIVAQEIRKLALLAEAGNFEKQIALDRKDSDLQTDTESLQALLAADEKALAVAKARAAVREADIDQQALSRRYLVDIANAQKLIAIAEASRDPTVRRGVELLREQKQLITETYQVERKIAEAKALALAEEERLARLRQSGTASEGVAEGIKQLQAARKSTATIMQDLVVNFADSLASALAQSVTTAIQTALHGGDVGAAITQIGEQLALNVLNGLLTDLFKNTISSLFSGIGETLGLTTSAAAAGATLSAAGTAAGDGMILGALGADEVLATATTAMTTAIGAAVTAALEAIAAAKLASVGGAGGKARGGKILPFGIPDTNRTGFARGGSTIRRSRPLGRDPRDTIPAMLRPGEWVIRPESVGKYGDRFMSLLNRGKINPALLRGLVGGSSSPAPTPKRSFATGGPVLAAAAPTQGAAQSVLLFHDEQTMDRSLAAGPDSMLRFARTHRASYRAALGV